MATAWLVLVLGAAAHAWLPDPGASLHVKYGEEPTEQFVGNSTVPDYFRILDKDDSSIVVGGRNTVYNLSLYDLSENVDQRLEWPSTDAHRELCIVKGKSVEECQNYPRVAARLPDGRTLVCATNAFKPLCRHYTRHPSGVNTHEDHDSDGSGRAPYDPQLNSTFIYTGEELFTATAADFSGTDSLIFRELPDRTLRTEHSDPNMLNDPSFVGGFATRRHAYFFFREKAVEYMNCGKAVYSRVARLCRNDKGGPHVFRDRWTSFMKARLNCSVPGDYPFYFDEIQSNTDLISGIYGKDRIKTDIMYAVFTTPQNAIGGSAVCAFSMRDMQEAFEGPFKGHESMNSNWLPLEKDKVPEPRPGACVEDSRTIPISTANFIKGHSLMDRAVPSFLARPLLIKVSLNYRFSAVAVHPQVQAMNGNRYDVVYVGTDDGRVIKTVNAAAAEGSFEDSADESSRSPVRTVVVSEVQVLQDAAIRQMHVALNNEKLIVASGDIIKSVSLAHCANVQTCRDCVALQDPHCAWDTKGGACAFVGARKFPNAERFLQSVERGRSDACARAPAHNRSPGTRPEPEVVVVPAGESNHIDHEVRDKHETDSLTINKAENTIYTAQALLTAVLASCLITLLVGFITGYLFSRRFRHPFFADTTPFNEQHNHLKRLSPLETPLNANPAAYLPPRCAKNINMVANVALKQDNLQAELKERRNSTESLDKDLKCGTLQKVKKTYI